MRKEEKGKRAKRMGTRSEAAVSSGLSPGYNAKFGL